MRSERSRPSWGFFLSLLVFPFMHISVPWCSSKSPRVQRNHPALSWNCIERTWNTLCGNTCPALVAPPRCTSSCKTGRMFYLQQKIIVRYHAYRFGFFRGKWYNERRRNGLLSIFDTPRETQSVLDDPLIVLRLFLTPYWTFAMNATRLINYFLPHGRLVTHIFIAIREKGIRTLYRG